MHSSIQLPYETLPNPHHGYSKPNTTVSVTKFLEGSQTETCACLFLHMCPKIEYLLNRKCLGNGDTLFIAHPVNLKIRCFEFSAVGISIFVVMDTFKFSVCAKTAVRILIMSGVWAGRVEKSVTEMLLLSAISTCTRLIWKAKMGYERVPCAKKRVGMICLGIPLVWCSTTYP